MSDDDDTYDFDGDTFDPERDGVRLTKQWKDVWLFMRDGAWHSLPAIAKGTGHPEASISARLRDFRKRRFGYHVVEREYMFDGLWMYRLRVNPKCPVELEEGSNV